MNIFFTRPKPSASHALVDFGDEGTTIIPFASFHLMPCLLLIDFLTVVLNHLRLIRNRLMLNSWTIFFCITFVIITRRYMVVLHVSWLFTPRGTSRLVVRTPRLMLLHVSWYSSCREIKISTGNF